MRVCHAVPVTAADRPAPIDPRPEVGCYRLVDSAGEVESAAEAAEAAEAGRAGRGERFETLEYALSAWGEHLQHGGPVAGLLVRAMDRCQPDSGGRISRLAVEILGPIPPVDVLVRSWVERPGRRIALLAAELSALQPDGGWRPVARARAWRLATAPTADVARHADPAAPVPEAMSLQSEHGYGDLPDSWLIGFVTALDWRFVRPLGQPGASSLAWVRLAQPLVAGERPTPLEQAVAICDVANGVGARLDPRTWTFLNTDLTIHLFEEPAGEWFGVEAETSVGHDGIGMSAATLHALSGPIGRVAQTLLLERRG